jgi:hypothetical protein
MLKRLNIELFILWINFQLLKRNFFKYYKYVIGLYFLSITGKYYPLRPAYYFARYVDDVADRDLPFPKNINSFDDFIKYVDSSYILNCVRNNLILKGIDKNIFEKNLEKFYLAMKFEYEREKNKQYKILELDNIYIQTFQPVIQITLWCLGSKIEASNINGLSLIQGIVYSYRDHQDDLGKGINNKPIEYSKYSDLEWFNLNKERIISMIKEINLKKIDKQAQILIDFILIPIKNKFEI